MKVAVVGLGMMGLLHSKILLSTPGVTSVIGVETDPQRAAQVSSELGMTVVSTLEDVIDNIDATSVTLPDSLHVEAAVRALRAGKYVLVEKPLATNSADCETILGAQQTPGRLMVGHVLRFDERLLEMKRRLDSGALGQIRYVKVFRTNMMTSGDRIGVRASVTAFLGVHDLDLLMWLTGQEVEQAQAIGRRFFTNSWDLSLANLTLTDGTLAQLENHWLLHRSSARSCLAGIQVFGDKGTALVDLSTAELELVTDEVPRSVRVDTRNWTHDATVSGGALRREITSFIRSAESREPVAVSGEDGYRAVRAVELVERAIEVTSL